MKINRKYPKPRGQKVKTIACMRRSGITSSIFLSAAAGCLTILAPGGAKAFDMYTGTYAGQNLQITLDTTVEYSTFYRVNDPSAVLTNNPNTDDGDRDFRHGIVANEFEAVPVFDLKYGQYGVHVSGQFYLNTSYLQKSQNNSPSTYNPYTTASNRDFTSATRNINGQNAMLLDAFAYGSRSFGADNAQQITVKFGRQTLLWGQSLFFSNNGIAAGQAPIDLITAQSLPNAETQQIVLPVGQAVVTYQPNEILTFQAYYQFEWEHDVFQGVGSYFSAGDFLDKGGERLIIGPSLYLYRTKDSSPPIQNGQFGASVQASLGNYDLGFFALRYDSKAPEVYTTFPIASGGPGNLGSYFLVYPRDIQIYGASLSTTVGPVNVAGEISGRRNMPLVQNPNAAPFIVDYPGSANAGALYPVGSTMAAQISEIYVSPGIPFDPNGLSITSEFAMNHVLSVDGGRAALDPGRDHGRRFRNRD
jgi:hypothetical protein